MTVSLAEIRERSGEVFTEGCPTRAVLDHIMSKWGVLVLLALSAGEHRWSELRRVVQGVSEKMLAQTLRALARYRGIAIAQPNYLYSLAQTAQARPDPGDPREAFEFAAAAFDLADFL